MTQRGNVTILETFVCFCDNSKPHAARNIPGPKGSSDGCEARSAGLVATNTEGDQKIFATFVRSGSYSVVYDENAEQKTRMSNGLSTTT